MAVVVAWRCRKRGKRFSRWLVYVVPFLLSVVFYFIQIRLNIDLMSPILGKEGDLFFITPYGYSFVTSGTLILLKNKAAFVHAGIGSLSLSELLCLHAGVLVLGLSLGLFVALILAFETGFTGYS